MPDKKDGGPGSSGKRPSFHKTVILDTWRGKPRKRKWPKPQPWKRKTQAEALNKFAQAQRLFSYTTPEQQTVFRELSKNSPYLPRDYWTAMLYGRLAYWRDSETGKVVYPMAAREEVSRSLDTISQTPGAMLYRTNNLWAEVSPGALGDVLTSFGPGAAPQWLPSSGGAGRWYFAPPAASDFPTTIIEGAATSQLPTDNIDIGLMLEALPSANNNFWGIFRPAPPTPFEIVAQFETMTPTNLIVGLALRGSASTRRVLIGADGAGGVDGYIVRTEINTAFIANSGLGQAAVRSTSALWVRVVVTSPTQIDYYISANGKQWRLWVASGANVVIADLDQIGIGVMRRGVQATAAQFSCGRFVVV